MGNTYGSSITGVLLRHRYEVVKSMSMGMSPVDAVTSALKNIAIFYPNYSGAMVAVTTSGDYGAAYTQFDGFSYTVFNPILGKSTVVNIR